MSQKCPILSQFYLIVGGLWNCESSTAAILMLFLAALGIGDEALEEALQAVRDAHTAINRKGQFLYF